MTLGADDGQTAGFLDARAELDVGTTTCHVGGDGHGARLTGFLDDLCFLEVQLGVQHVVRDALTRQHAAEQLGDLHRGGTHQHGTACLDQILDLVDDGVVFLTLGLVDHVLLVDTGDGAVGRDDDDVEFVDVPELARLRLSGTGHTGQLVVHTEVVLQGDGGVGLCGGFHLHVFLGLHGLVQSVAPTAAFHDTARLLVHDLHLVVDDDVVDVLLKQGVGLQQLLHGVQTFRLLGEVTHQLGLAQHLLVVAEVGVFQVSDFGTHVGDDEERRVVVGLRQLLAALVGEDDGIQFLVDDEVELVVDDVHVLVTVLHIEALGLLHQALHAFLAEELDEGVVLGQATVGAEELVGTMFLLVFGGVGVGEDAFGLSQDCRHITLLGFIQLHDVGLQLVKLLLVAARRGTADDQRRTGIVDQHGVDLVDDGIVVFALHQLFGVAGHVVTQVVEAELVVGTVGDVAVVGAATCGRVGFVLVDAVDGEAEELIHRAHPLRVTFGQVVVHGDDVDTFAGEGVEVDGQGSHEGLTFTGGHLSDLALMQHDTADDLAVVVHHVPSDHVAASHPAVLVVGLVAHDGDVLVFGCQLAIEVGGSHLHGLVFAEVFGGGLHHRERLGQDLVQRLFDVVELQLFQLVDLVVEFLLLVGLHVGVGFGLGFQLGDFGHLGSGLVLYVFLECCRCRVSRFRRKP